jgi:protein-disulfide isomerase
MKKNITIAVIVILALAFGYYLFKLSPQTSVPGNSQSSGDFDLSQVKDIKEPRAVGSGDYVLGNPAAKNTMIVYEDFQCPACASYAPITEQFPVALTDTKLVFRHYPLPQHKNAVSAAYAAEAAGVQGKFWEMYDKLYETQGSWEGLANPADMFAQLAGQIGLGDINKFKSDMSAKAGKNKIQEDWVEALSLNLGGTPSLYFNGQPIKVGNLEQVKVQAEKLYKQ